MNRGLQGDDVSERGPDFLGLGVQRSGSTWLHAALERTPGVWVPPVKELHYWSTVGDRGQFDLHRRRQLERRHEADGSTPGATGAGRESGRPDPVWERAYFDGEPSDDWYCGLFPADVVSGEITPAYLRIDGATIDRVVTRLPHLRAFVVLRDPIDRSWSALSRFVLRDQGLDADQLGDDALVEFAAWPPIRDAGFYEQCVGRWSDALGDALKVAWYEDLVADPARFLADLLAFLGVDADADEVVGGLGPRFAGAAGTAPPARLERELASWYLPSLRVLRDQLDDRTRVDAWISRAEAALR
jgi:hypothetical protein